MKTVVHKIRCSMTHVLIENHRWFMHHFSLQCRRCNNQRFRFVSVLDIRVHYNLALPPGAIHSTIVLIRGFLCNTFTWHRCLQALADRTECQVLAYDRFAFGLTERALDKEQYSRKNEELLALELLKQLNITDRVHVVSSSSGAMAAHDVALARPDLVRSLILVAPYDLVTADHPSGPISRFLIGTKPIQFLMKFGLTHFLLFKNTDFNPDFAKDESIRQGYLQPIRDHPLFIPYLPLFTQHYDLGSMGSLQKLGRDQKVLIIIGEQVKIVPRQQSDELYQLLHEGGSTERVIIPQCGHLPQEERVNELIRLISEFICRNYYSKPSNNKIVSLLNGV